MLSESAMSIIKTNIFFFIFRDLNDRTSEAKAAAGLGNVHLNIGDVSNALKYHELDLGLSQEFDDSNGQIRAFGNLGSTMEALGNREESIKMFERQLSVAVQMGDHVGQTNALGSLGNEFFTFFSICLKTMLTYFRYFSSIFCGTYWQSFSTFLDFFPISIYAAGFVF